MLVTMTPQASAAKRPTRRKSSQPTGADPTRAKLLAAAAEVFAEVGFQAATVREIGEPAIQRQCALLISLDREPEAVPAGKLGGKC